MEYEFAKLTQLGTEQKNIRAEFEVLEKMPVGKEAFQDDYDQKFAHELEGDGEPGEVAEE